MRGSPTLCAAHARALAREAKGFKPVVPRFLQVNTFYPDYLVDFYARRPQLQSAPYEVQIGALLDDGFSGVHMFARSLRAHGFETMQVVANNRFAQSAWLREHGHQGAADFASVVQMQVKEFAPDVFYTTDVTTFNPRFFSGLHARPPVIAGWRGFPLMAAEDLSCFDLILTSFDRMFDEAKDHGARRVERFHPGFPRDCPVLAEPRRFDWDVVVSGSVTAQHKRRVQIVNMLGEMSRDPAQKFTFGLFAPRAEALSPAVQVMNKGALWGLDMLRLIRNACMVVNIDVDAFDGQPPNMRLIEATGVGAFLITSPHPELSKFFEPGEELETFRTPQELAAKIQYYLAMPERASEIARRGQERCLRDHAHADRTAWFAHIMRNALGQVA